MSQGAVFLQVKGIDFTYHGETRPTLRNVTLTVSEGELITLLGPNGAGKSTLLNCMAGFLQPQTGSIMLDGMDIRSMNAREISRQIAYVQQNPTVTFSHTVREYIAMGRAPYLGMLQRPSEADYRLVDETIERMDIERLTCKNYNQLSGGERQLVNVCRAIVQQPKLILFDEPTSALDYGNQIRVLRMIRRLADDGFAILLTTHNPDHPFQLRGTICTLSRDGHLKSGSAEELMTEPYLNEMYKSRLKIRYFDEEKRMICISESL